jgi:hypothetical protein
LSLNTSTGAITGTPTAAGTSNFTVKAANGTSPDATQALSITVSSTPPTPPTSYSVIIGTHSNGSLSTNKSSATAGETVTVTATPNAGYELDGVEAFRTAFTSTPVALSGSGGTYTFTMPAYGVTVAATFRVAPHPDGQAVDDAKYVIEHASFAVAQSSANTQEGVREWLVSYINTLLRSKGVTISLNDVTVSSFTAATAGTDNVPAGVNGSFTITLTKGGHTAAASTSGTVTAGSPSACR